MNGEYNVEEEKSRYNCVKCGKYVWREDRTYPYHKDFDGGLGPVMCRDCYRVVFKARLEKWEANFERGA